MEAMVFLIPSLPSVIERKYSVIMAGYHKDSGKITLDGPMSGIEQAYEHVQSQVGSLLKDVVNLEYDCPMEQLEVAQHELRSEGVYLLLEPSSKRVVNLYHFCQLDIVGIQQRLKSLLISTKTVSCKPEQVIFLQHCSSEARISRMLSSISFDKEAIVLKGTPPSMENAEKVIGSILSEINWHKVSLSVPAEVESHIKGSILEAFQKPDGTFKYFIKRSSETHCEVYIFSTNASIYAEACKLLDQLDPVTRQYPLPETADEIVAEMQSELESNYLVRIVCCKSSVTIHGLVASRLDQCYHELRIKIESTLSSMKLLPISNVQNRIFRQLYKDELNSLRKQCSSLSLENNNLKVMGTIKQVNDVVTQLNSGLLNFKVYSEIFSVKCRAQECEMWRKWWQQLKENSSKVLIITFTKSGDTEFNFEVLGTDNSEVSEVKAAIMAKEVQESLIPLPRMALKSLNQARQENQLKFLDKLTVRIVDMNEWKKEVALCAPQDCANDLKTAIEEIRSFVGDHEQQSEWISSRDPVVRLILQSQHSDSYLSKAQAEVEQYDVTVSVSREKDVVGLEITGTRSFLEIATPIIKRLTIEAIEKSIDQKLVGVKHTCTPLLTTPEFDQLKSKLMDKFCVACSLNQNFNQPISTSRITLHQESFIQIDIIKGSILCEHVDAIVNAANEDLQHLGGLAQAISVAGGSDIQSESKAYVQKNSKIKPGEAVCLGPGGLLCKHVIHAVGPRWKDGKDDEENVLYSAVLNSLKLANEAGLRSIAIPAISTGIFYVPAEVCAKASFKAVEEFASTHPKTSLRNIKFVLLDQNVVDVFSAFTEKHQKKGDSALLKGNSVPPTANVSVASIQFLHESVVVSPSDETSTRMPPPAAAHPMSPSKSTPSSVTPAQVDYLWEWMDDRRMDDRRRYARYTAEVNRQLNSAYHENPHGSCLIKVNSSSYTVDFVSMRQTNNLTGFKRAVTKSKAILHAYEPKKFVRKDSWAARLKGDTDETISTQSFKVTWQYLNNSHVFTPYSLKDSECIERMYKSNALGYIIIEGKKYRFDFKQMVQISDHTKHKRKICRQVSSISTPTAVSTSKETPVATSYTLTLRGPRESLPVAEKSLVDELNRYIVQDAISVTVMTEELRGDITRAASENNVDCSLFEEMSKDGSMQEVVKLEGIKSKVQEAARSIHEQVLKHVESVREKEKSEYEELLRQATKVSAASQNQPVPPEWEPQHEKVVVFEVSRGSAEWLHVEEKFDLTMSSHTIDKITRIQNILQWEKYSLSKKQLEEKHDGDANEMELFHGSRRNNPEDIYGGEDAFDMRHSEGGMWGRANYFAANASYSANYSHSDYSHQIPMRQAISRFVSQPLSSHYPRVYDATSSQRKILLAKVLVGESFESHSDHRLRMPPTKPGSKERYDSVSGHTSGSDVYMTYDNARAYPAYLITYSDP